MDVSHRAGAGWIEVIAGSMFSGKSEELIRRLRRAQIAQAQGADLQAAHRQPLQRRPHRRTARCRSPSESVDRARELLDARAARHRGRRHRRGAVLRPRAAGGLQHARRPGQARHRRRASTRTTSASPSSRCRSCSPSPSTSPRRWPSAWSAAPPPTTRSASSPAASACSSARQGAYEARCRHCFDPRLGQ